MLACELPMEMRVRHNWLRAIADAVDKATNDQTVRDALMATWSTRSDSVIDTAADDEDNFWQVPSMNGTTDGGFVFRKYGSLQHLTQKFIGAMNQTTKLLTCLTLPQPRLNLPNAHPSKLHRGLRRTRLIGAELKLRSGQRMRRQNVSTERGKWLTVHGGGHCDGRMTLSPCSQGRAG